MIWLYGDSSTSPLEVNFIDFLRLAMDFAVEILLVEDFIGAGRERRHRLAQEGDAELARLEALGAAVHKMVDGEARAADSAAARCAAAIARAAADCVRGEVATVKARLEADAAKLDGEAARERERCVKALETLLLRYDLPDTETTLLIDPTGSGAYAARLRGVTSYGVETVVGLDIPPANPFSHEVRVDRLMEGLEVRIPETGGFLRKQTRIASHKLGKYRIARVSANGGEVRVELRAGADAHAAGFQLVVTGERPGVTLAPVGRDGETASAPFEPDPDDTAKLRQLSERLAGVAAELARSRKALVEARLEGEPLVAHPHPSVLVERLIAALTPTVRAIAQHSLSPSELVLRRLLGGDRREEVFVSKSELWQKLDPLPVARRMLFDPLGLMDGVPVPIATASVPPLPLRARTEPVEPAMVIDDGADPAGAATPKPIG
jgi:hypothetical protein